jgi:HEAT repeats
LCDAVTVRDYVRAHELLEALQGARSTPLNQEVNSASVEEMLKALDVLVSETTVQNQNRAMYRLAALVPSNLGNVAIDRLHAILESDPGGPKHWAAALMLVRLGSSDIARFQAALFREPNFSTRQMLVTAAKNFPSELAENYLFEICISDDDDDVRITALRALANRWRDRAIEAVREFLAAGVQIGNYASKAQEVMAPLVTEAEVSIVFELSNLSSSGLNQSALRLLSRFTNDTLLHWLEGANVSAETRGRIRKAIEERSA